MKKNNEGNGMEKERGGGGEKGVRVVVYWTIKIHYHT